MERLREQAVLCLILVGMVFKMYSEGGAAALVFLQTGQRPAPVQLEVPGETEPAQETETAVPRPTEPPEEKPGEAVFCREDGEAVQVNAFCSYAYDIGTLLKSPLNWNLKSADPAVLILHTHTTESYENTEGYQQTDPYRCRDAHYNMVSVGQAVGQVLQAQGIAVLHDTTVHDEPSYNRAYDTARVTAERYLQQYPSLQLVLDLHRDAAEDSRGNQVAYTVPVAQEESAMLMIVVGTDEGGLYHPEWEKNLALAVKLHAKLEQLAPGICRPIAFRAQRFNQDLSSGSLLIEVGSAGNTRQQALRAAEILGRAIGELAGGAVYAG